MADLLQSADGAERLADALLRSNGGDAVFLRIPSPASASDDAEQLGLATPVFQDVPLAPAVWRKGANEMSLLLSASAVRSVVGALNAASAEALFCTAAGVVSGGILFEIVAFSASEANGEPFCYRLAVRAPQS